MSISYMLYVVFSGQEKDHIGKNRVTERNIIKNSYKRLRGHLSPFPFQKIPSKTEVSRSASSAMTVIAKIYCLCALCERPHGANLAASPRLPFTATLGKGCHYDPHGGTWDQEEQGV